MTDNDTQRSSYGADSGPTAPPGEPIVEQLRGLRRSRDDKVLAGVCGGLARSLRVDPLLLRVVIAVMVLFGGTGIVLYAIAWLLMPMDDGTPSVGAQALDRGRYQPSSQTVWLAVLLAVAASLGVLGIFGNWDRPLLVTLAVIGLVVWLARSNRAGRPSQPGQQGQPGQPAGPPVYPPPPVPPVPPVTAPVQDTPGLGDTLAVPPPGGQVPPPWQPAYPAAPPPLPPRPPVPPRPPRERSHLFAMTLSVVLIGLGVLATADVLGADPSAGAYPALALALTGAGLLVGAWYGRSRSLIFWGLLLALITTVTTVASHAEGIPNKAVDDTVTVTQVDQLPTDDRYGAGQVQYDLTGLDLAGQSAKMHAQIGFGEIVVVVPENVDVTVHARTGVGGLTLFGTESGGVNDKVDRTDVGPDGPGGGTLDLDLYAGFGHLEVRRATS